MKENNPVNRPQQSKFDLFFDDVIRLTGNKEYAKALEIATQLIQQKQHQKEDLQNAKLNEAIGDIYTQLKDHQPALDYLQNVLNAPCNRAFFDLLVL